MCIDPTKTYTAHGRDQQRQLHHRRSTPKPRPHTVNNFVVLSRYHFYDGIPFHRIVPGFVVQCGDPTGTGGGGPGYTFADELPASEESYKAGTVAMANSGAEHQRQPVLRHPRPLRARAADRCTRCSARSRDGFDTTVKALEAAGQAGQTPIINKVTITES